MPSRPLVRILEVILDTCLRGCPVWALRPTSSPPCRRVWRSWRHQGRRGGGPQEAGAWHACIPAATVLHTMHASLYLCCRVEMWSQLHAGCSVLHSSACCAADSHSWNAKDTSHGITQCAAQDPVTEAKDGIKDTTSSAKDSLTGSSGTSSDTLQGKVGASALQAFTRSMHEVTLGARTADACINAEPRTA